MPKLCCCLETITLREINDCGYVVAALAGDDLLTNLEKRDLTNLEHATALTGRSACRACGKHLHRTVMRRQSR
jgi:hypothetical protein